MSGGSFKLRDQFNSYLVFNPPNTYTSTGDRSLATTFSIFDDPSVANNNIGYVAIRNESTGKFIRELYQLLYEDEFIPLDAGYGWRFNEDGSIEYVGRAPQIWYLWNGVISGNPRPYTRVYETDPTQTSVINVDDTSIKFDGVLTFDGVKNHIYINPRLEFIGTNAQDGFDFTCLINFKPQNVSSGTVFMFKSSSDEYIRMNLQNSTCILEFFNVSTSTSYIFPVFVDTSYEVYISSKRDTLDVKLNGSSVTPTSGSNNPIGGSFYKPIILGAYVYGSQFIENDFYTGDITKFIVYNSFVDYDTITEKYIYGQWAPFDSNTNTIFKISKDLYSEKNTPRDYITGNTIVSSNGITLFTTSIPFEIKSSDFEDFVSGNRISLVKKSGATHTFEYSTKGGADIIFSQDVTLAANTNYNVYAYITPSGKIGGNFFPSENTGRYLFSDTGEYTISTNVYVYDHLVPESDFFVYGYTGSTSTQLIDGSSVLGEYVDIDLNRKLGINKISSTTIGASQPSLVHYGSDGGGLVYEKWTRGKPYTNMRTIVEKSTPRLITGNYVIEYTSNGNSFNMYEYSQKSFSSTFYINRVNGDIFAGHYGVLPSIFKGLSFPKVNYTNLESVIFKDDGSWKCRVYSSQTSDSRVDSVNRIYSTKLTDNLIVYGRASNVPTVFEDSSGTTFNISGRSYIVSMNQTNGTVNWIAYYSSTGGDIMDMDVYQPDGTILIYTQSGTLTDSRGTNTQISTDIAAPIRLTRDGVFIDYAPITTNGTFNYTCSFDDYGSYYIGGFTQSYGGTVNNSDGSSSSVGLGNGGGGFRAFLLKYGSNGYAQWSFYEPYQNIYTNTNSCTSKGSKVYMVLELGNSRSSATFQRNGSGNYTLPDDGLPDNAGRCVIIQLDLNGYPQNYFMISNKSSTNAGSYPSGVRVDDDGSFYAWRSSVDSVVYAFEANAQNPVEILGGSSGAFSVLVKYSADGKIVWTRRFYEHDNDFINDVEIRGGLLTVCTSYGSQFVFNHPGYNFKTIVYTLNKYSGDIIESDASAISKLPGYTSPSIGTSYWEVYGLCTQYANVTADNSSNVSVFVDNDKYKLTFIGETNVYGLESYIPEDSFVEPDDIKIQRINITPFQLKTRVSSNVTKIQTILGANFEARARGEQSISTLFDSSMYGKGYRFIDAYDGIVTPSSNIVLDWTLYGSETINLESTGEAVLYVDGNLAIDISGSNTLAPDQLHACKLVYTQNTLGIPYVSLDGISNAYALKPDSFVFDSNVYEYQSTFFPGITTGYGYNNKSVNITRVGNDFVAGLQWSLYDGFSNNDPVFYTSNTPFAQGSTSTFNFNLYVRNPPFPTGTRFKIRDTVTGNYIGLNSSTTTIETSSTDAITFEAFNDPTVYNNNDGGIALKAVAGLNYDNEYLRHAGYVVYSNPFGSYNFDFAWKFIPTGDTNSFYIYNWFGGGYYLDFDGTYTRITTNSPPRVWNLEFTESVVTSLTGGAYVSGPSSNSIQWSGYITADEGGSWEFGTSSNCFLRIGDSNVAPASSSTITLENATTYPFVVQKGLQYGDDAIEFTYKRPSDGSIQKDWTGLLYYPGPQKANLVLQTSTGSVYVNSFSVSNLIIPDGDYTLTMNSINWNTNYFILDGFSSYVKLSNSANVYYTKYSSGIIETPFVLNGISACFSDIVKYTGNVANLTYSWSNIVNLDYTYARDDQSNAYTLTLKKQLPGVETYIYNPDFRSVLNESNTVYSNLLLTTTSFASGTSSIGGGGGDFINMIIDGNFVVPETGTYNVYPVYDSYSIGTNNVYDTNRMTYTIYGSTGASSYTFEKGDTVNYSINYYHANNPVSYADLNITHVDSGNVYFVSNLTFSDVYRTKISNFYKTTTVDANYDIIR